MFSRTIDLIGPDQLKKIQQMHVLVLGLGGVGSFAVEALARSGVKHFILVDKDRIDESNLNRQLPALRSTIGQSKVALMKERILDIQEDAEVQTYHSFYNFETKDEILSNKIDAICDCIDTVTFKIDIQKEAHKRSIQAISVLGTGNKLDPTMLEVASLNKTSYCPLGRVMRKKLADISKDVMVVYSKEQPTKYHHEKRTPASMVFVPSSAGILAASVLINNVLQK
jgi:tRNA A37 threonylcarbamoyladenosine dehydratase